MHSSFGYLRQETVIFTIAELRNMTIIIFWFCLSVILYCYVGYGIFLIFFNKIKFLFQKKHPGEDNFKFPPVTLVVAMYNEEAILEAKILNSLEIDYPGGEFQILFIDDGSTDGTKDILLKYPLIRLISHECRKGKAAAIKTAMQQVTTPIVVFSDANSMLNKQCLRKLVRHYRDPLVGAVAGEKRIVSKKFNSMVGRAEGLYWQYESFLKKQEADFFTAVGAAGELFSVRTFLFQSINDDTITDDFIISMQVCLQGYRVAYEKEAYSAEMPSSSIWEEAKRKIRIATGNFQAIGYLSKKLNLFKHPLLFFQYFSHRVLRWLFSPFLLPVVMISNIVVVYQSGSKFYLFFLFAQALFYLAGALGWLLVRGGHKAGIFLIPFYFVFMNVCLIIGLFIFLKGQHTVLWKKSLRTESPIISE